jgi:hypothetical protein
MNCLYIETQVAVPDEDLRISVGLCRGSSACWVFELGNVLYGVRR